MYAASHAEGQYTQALNSMSHAEGKGTCTQEEEDSLFTKYTVYSIPTPEGKPVRVAYNGKDTDTQQHSDTHTHTHTDSMIDTHTHIQQEDTTHVYSVEDTHYYTRTDSMIDTRTDNVVDTHTLTHSDVVYDTQEIDTYIHSMIDIH